MSDERRRSPRVEILDRIHGHVASLNVPVIVRDMSLGGMSLETPFPFPIGAVHEFRLQLGDESTTMLRGKIVRCLERLNAAGETVYVSGVMFLDEEPPDGDGVGDLLGKI